MSNLMIKLSLGQVGNTKIEVFRLTAVVCIYSSILNTRIFYNTTNNI